MSFADIKFKKNSILNRKVDFKEIKNGDRDPQYMILRAKYTPLNKSHGFQRDYKQSEINKETSRAHDKKTDQLFPFELLKSNWVKIYPVGPGFNNAGNTCFLNAVVQCLLYNPVLINYFLSNDHTSRCQKIGYCSLCSMARLFNSSLKERRNYPRYPDFVRHLKLIAKHMRVGRQEDAHEFLRFLIESFQKSSLETYGQTNYMDNERKRTNPIFQIFGGIAQSKVTCLHCKKDSKTNDPIMDLALDIKGCDSIQRAMQNYVKSEMLSGNNKYYCESCKQKRDARKSLHIYRPPKVLTLQLKRFEFTPFGGKKLTRNVSYPEKLDLNSIMCDGQSSPIYNLFGVLVHSGHTSNSGHYYSFIKSPSGAWYCMDDSSVNQVKFNTVLKQSAYILFYSAKDSPSNSSVVAPKLSKPLDNTPTKNNIEKLSVNEAIKIKHTLEDTLRNYDISVPSPPTSPKNLDNVAYPPKKYPKMQSDVISKLLSAKKPENDEPPSPPSEPKSLETKGGSNDAVVVKWNDNAETKRAKLSTLSSRKRTEPSDNYKYEFSGHNVLLGSFKSPSKLLKRPDNYDIDYDKGRTKKTKRKNRWRIFDIQKNRNPFSEAAGQYKKSHTRIK